MSGHVVVRLPPPPNVFPRDYKPRTSRRSLFILRNDGKRSEDYRNIMEICYLQILIRNSTLGAVGSSLAWIYSFGTKHSNCVPFHGVLANSTQLEG